MNTVPNLEADLTPERKQRVKDELEQSFRDPQILQMFDAVLSRQAQIQGNRNNSAVPLGPVAPVVAVRNYALDTETSAIYADIDGNTTATNPTQIQDAWTSLNNLINDWLLAYPVNERDVMRQRFQYLLHNEIKSVIKTKTDSYTAKKRVIDTACDNYHTNFSRLRTDALTQLSLIANGLPLSSGFAGPDPANAAVTDFSDFLYGFNRTNIDHTPAFVTTFNLRHTALMSYLRTFTYSNLGPPNDKDKIAALNALSTCKVTILNEHSTLSGIVSANSTDHNGSALPNLDALNRRVTLLEELNTSVYKPATEEIMSRDVRYQNVQIAAGTEFSIIGKTGAVAFPNSMHHPRKTAVSATSYTRGTPFSLEDYGTYFEWAQTNRAKVSTEQSDANTENSSTIVNEINNTLGPQLTALKSRLAGGTITVYQVKTQIRRLVGNFFGHTTASPNTELAGYGVHPLVDTADQMSVVQNLLRWHFNVNSQTDLINGLSNNLIHRLNLPNTAEQAANTTGNRESYAELASNAGILFGKPKLAENRVNYLTSLRAQIYETLQEKYKGKDLTDPKIENEFSTEFIKLVMQARLDTLNETLKHKEKTWMSKITEYWSDVNGSRLAITAGLAIAAMISGIYLDSTVITPVVTTVQSLWSSGVALIAPHFTGGALAGTVKALGIGTTFAVGQRASRTLANTLAYNMPWSPARYRSKRKVLGSEDSAGNSSDGLGEINTSTGTYDHAKVQRALAAQIAFAENRGGKFALTEGDGINPLLGDKHKRKLSTAQHLWEREKKGMRAVIKNQINTVSIDPTIPQADKNNAMIIAALDSVYNPGRMEDSFLEELEKSRAKQAAMSKIGLFGSIATGTGLAGAFNIRF